MSPPADVNDMKTKTLNNPLYRLLLVVTLFGWAPPGHTEVKLDSIAPRLANASPAKGEKIFLQCRACHLATPDGRHTVGPNLWGVIGREVASQPDFPYSDALQAIGGNWDYETLNRYLFDPAAMAPGSRMVFAGLKRANDRAHVIAYLRALTNEEPLALPAMSANTGAPTYGGLPEGEGREAVYFTCRACHALEQFTHQALSRESWDELLDEMVADNGMEAPEAWARELILGYLATHFTTAPEDHEDWDGLPPGEGREEVYHSCSACHSLMLVRQQGMSRTRWDETLEWMVDEQGMTPIDDVATRDRILDYLAAHFGSG